MASVIQSIAGVDFNSTDTIAAESVAGVGLLFEARTVGGADIHLLRDEFVDTDDTHIESHTPDVNNTGDVYNEDNAGSDWTIQGNALDTVGTTNHVRIDTGFANVFFAAEIEQPPTVNGNLMAIANNNNGSTTTAWLAVMIQDGGVDYIRVYEQDGGAFTQRSSTSLTPIAGDHIAAISVGDTFVARIYDSNYSVRGTAEYTVASRQNKTESHCYFYDQTDYDFERAFIHLGWRAAS